MQEKKCVCRSDVTFPSRSYRLDTESGSVQQHKSTLGPSGARSIRHKTVGSTQDILQLETRTSSRESGYISTGLVGSQRVCTSPLVLDFKMPEEGQGPTSNTSPDYSHMVCTTMVSSGPHDVDRLPEVPPSTGQPSSGDSQRRSSTDSNSTESGRMAHFRRFLTDKGLSSKVEELLSSSWRKGTHKNNDTAWRKWEQWCINKHVSPISSSLNDILSFLTDQFHAGHSYRLLNVYRSAISSIHPKIDGYPLVCRLLKGAFNMRPPLPKYQSTWSVETIILYVKSLGKNEALSLKQITHKLLLALTTASRSSDLSLLTVTGCSFVQEGVRCNLAGLSKQSRPRHSKPAIEVAHYPDSLVCPVVCLKQYIEVTKKFRAYTPTGPQPNQLFIGISKPHAPVQACTIAQWVKTVLKEAGINTGYAFQRIRHKERRLQQQCLEEHPFKKCYLKLTGHHIALFTSIITDHSHFLAFLQLCLR